MLGLTRLAVDLIEQGVGLHWSGISHPQTQGKVERFFGTLGTALRHRGGPPQAFEQWAEVLGEIRQEYNHVRPHEALDMQVPADRYRASPLASSHPETHYLSFLKGCFLYQIQRFMGDSIGRQQGSGGRVLQMQFSTNTSPSKSPSIMASSDSFTTVAGPTPTD